MTVQTADAYELLRKIRYDLTAAQAKVTDALKVLAALNLPDVSRLECETCGPLAVGPRGLAEHLFNSHGGPLPEHWQAGDSLCAADFDTVESATGVSSHG